MFLNYIEVEENGECKDIQSYLGACYTDEPMFKCGVDLCYKMYEDKCSIKTCECRKDYCNAHMSSHMFTKNDFLPALQVGTIVLALWGEGKHYVIHI